MEVIVSDDGSFGVTVLDLVHDRLRCLRAQEHRLALASLRRCRPVSGSIRSRPGGPYQDGGPGPPRAGERLQETRSLLLD